MRRLFNFSWFISFFGFFVALSLSYAFLPEQVGIHANARGIADKFISKETFFYLGLITFVGCNLVAFFFFRLMEAIPSASGFYFKSTIFKENIRGWYASFITVINLFLALGAAYISLYNNQGYYQIDRFNTLIFIAPLLAVFSLVWLVYIFANRHKQPAID